MKAFAYRSELGLRNQAARAVWLLVWTCFFRFTPRLPGFWAWRRSLLRLFGAKIGRGVKVYPSARIWAPWNLEAGDYCLIGDNADIYTVNKVVLGDSAWVSQHSFICTAGHSITDPGRALITRPIHIEKGGWVAAGAYIGSGVTLGEGAVAAAWACVVKDVEAWTVVGGNPARRIKRLKPRKAAAERTL